MNVHVAERLGEPDPIERYLRARPVPALAVLLVVLTTTAVIVSTAPRRGSGHRRGSTSTTRTPRR